MNNHRCEYLEMPVLMVQCLNGDRYGIKSKCSNRYVLLMIILSHVAFGSYLFCSLLCPMLCKILTTVQYLTVENFLSRQKTEIRLLTHCNERLHEDPSSEQMHPYVDKVRTVGYLDETHRPCSPHRAIVSLYYYRTC